MKERYSRLHVAKKAKPKGESSIVAFTKLLSVPTILLIVIASLDNADKQLLASSFPIFENLLNWNVKELGYFSLATNLSYALSLPVWGWLIHQYSGTRNLQKLLAYACGAWGIAMISIAVATLSASTTSSKTGTESSFWTHIQISVRAMNGAALGSILPLSQSLLVEYVPANYRGQAFGLMGAGEKLAGTLSSAAVVYLGENHWQYAYYGLGVLSIVMGFLARYMSLGSTGSITNNARQHAVAEQEKKQRKC
ncbi:EmrB/QacA family drug resistance transporter [Nitzschia inconspicua]|uniref:EmrB/QacA family drug resistance transporter n=1 Tax=Nitzschia inconspicua TaxID=303405 RepID=A0A9K3Q5J7_9STRA|nr:EmrB/QacA family drug resistance transporter [Nitzschia inconspicua]